MNKYRKFGKYVLWILSGIVISIFLLVAISAAFLYFNSDSIKKFLVDEINKQLATEISVKEIDLTLFRNFPDVSLLFSEVTAKDAVTSGNKGNLLNAGEVYLQFSIWDLFDGNYCIKNIYVKNAFINLMVFKDGSDNYHFWKADTSASDKSFSFDLQKLVSENVSIRYRDFDNNTDYSGIAEDVVIKGKFSSDNFKMYVSGDIFINCINVEGVNYFPSENALVDLVLLVDQNTNTCTFDKGEVDFGKLKFETSGNVIYSSNKRSVQLKIVGDNLSLQSFIEEIPQQFSRYFDDYKSRGGLYFTACINGSFAGDSIPAVKIDFGINNGKITHKKSDTALEELSFTGEFSNGYNRSDASSFLKIKNFKTRLKSGTFTGDLTVRNFINPEIELEMDAEMDIKEVCGFIKIDTIENISGNAVMKVSFRGKLNDNGNFTAADFINSKTTGTLAISKVNLALKNDTKKYNDINGHFLFSNNDLIINKLTGKISSGDFAITGFFRNLLPYLFMKDQMLYVNAGLTSACINLDEMLTTGVSASDTSYKLTFSDKLNVIMDVDIGKLNFNKFNASAIKGKIILKNQQMLISPFSFASMSGNVSGLVMIDGSQQGKLLISSNTDIKNVNINTLFYEFNNFGQSSMKAENLKGVVTAGVQFSGVWSNNLKPETDKIYAKADITIKDGELLNYAPMKGLSKFLKLADLNDVKFATLHNQIEIKNRTIKFPAMEIKSSAINIAASGEHNFDNEINYRIRVLLSDLLAKKARKAKPENEEFGVIEDDGLGKTTLYILITGTVDNPLYKYDGKGVKAKLAADFMNEKITLKKMLNEEFGWFKKDSAVINSPPKKKIELKPKDKEKANIKKQEEGHFIIEWGDSIE